MKKYRIAKVDGTYDIIVANNIDQAISIARNKYGQLPNEINKKIIKDTNELLQEMVDEIEKCRDTMLQESKELDWNAVYNRINECMKTTEDKGRDIRNKLGSMVKIEGGNK